MSANTLQVLSARELRGRSKNDQIIRAATEVFLDVGYAAASIDKIVERSGVSTRTLYKYYSSKEEIFVRAIRDQLASLEDVVSPYAGGDEQELSEGLVRIGISWLLSSNSPSSLSLIRVLAGEANHFPALAAEFFSQRMEKNIRIISDILRDGAGNAGLTIPDPVDAAAYFIELLFGTLYLMAIFNNPMSNSEIEMRARRATRYVFLTFGKCPSSDNL